jgi:aldehyde:ferredoxin oxidoreductase
VELSRNLQIATAAIDSTGMCLFIAFAILDQPDTFNALVDLVGAFIGQPMTADDVTALGKSVLKTSANSTWPPASPPRTTGCPTTSRKKPLAPHNVTFGVDG